MLCDICHMREATVHLTEIVNNKVKKIHLCEECAREKSEEMESHFGLTDLLAGLANLVPVVEEEHIAEATGCPSCGFTFNKFRKIGRLGCPKCYEAFQNSLSPLLKKIHGSDRHTGKIPVVKEVVRGKTGILAELRKRLEEAVKQEEFEEAAMLRDQIRDIEKKLKTDTKRGKRNNENR